MSDLIDRHEAIDAVMNKCTNIYVGNLPVMVDKKEVYSVLQGLISVTPKQSEIIHCCDCKKYHKLECPFGIGFGTPSRNDYCYQAKGRTDD